MQNMRGTRGSIARSNIDRMAPIEVDRLCSRQEENHCGPNKAIPKAFGLTVTAHLNSARRGIQDCAKAQEPGVHAARRDATRNAAKETYALT